MFENCIVHIGPNKTGTSSIQETLYDNCQFLESLNYHFPLADRKSYFIASYFTETPMQITGNATSSKSVEEIQAFDDQQINLLVAQSKKSCEQTLLLSSEWLCGLTATELTSFQTFLKSICKQITILAYIRDPIEHAVSLLQQDVWLAGELLETNKISSGHYPYIIEKFSRAFSKDRILCRKFSPENLVDGDVVKDYLSVLGISAANIEKMSMRRINEGRSVEALLVASAYNRLFPFKKDGELNPNRSLIPIIARLPGKKFTITQEEYRTIHERFHKDYNYIQETLGIQFNSEKHYPEKCVPAWGPETLETLAYAHYQTEKELQQTKSQLLFEQAQNSHQKSDLDKTIDLLKKALEVDLSNFDALSLLLSILEDTGNTEVAANIASEFFKSNQSSPSHLFLFKNLLFKLGKSEEAKRLKLSPKKPAQAIRLTT